MKTGAIECAAGALECGSLLPLWSRELARGFTSERTVYHCTASELASGKAAASYRTPNWNPRVFAS